MEPFDTFEHAGLLIELHYDEDCSSPQENDNAGKLYSWTPAFDGDERIHEPDLVFWDDDEPEDVDLPHYMRVTHGAVLTIPLRFSDYGSSGARIYVSDDPNCCICFTQEDLDKEWNGSVDDATAYATARIRELDEYFQGECVGFVVKHPHGEEIDPRISWETAVWGFIGDAYGPEAYVRQQAREAAEYVRSALDREEREAAEWAARDVVTA
jgi:hypothetical protein